MTKLGTPIKIHGLGPIGMAFVPGDERQPACNGFFVNHRIDGTARLFFDLYVLGTGRGYCDAEMREDYPRRISVEFDVNNTDRFHSETAIVVSRRSWEDLTAMVLPGGDLAWPDFDPVQRRSITDGTVWRGVPVRTTCIMLGRPTLRAESTTHCRRPPLCGLMGLWDSDDPCCTISQQWLNRVGTLLVDAQCCIHFRKDGWI